MVNISKAELEVMQILWDKNEATSLEIIDILSNKNNWDSSTIRTLIIRLKEKKAISISKKVGRVYTYTSNINKDEYMIKVSKNFLNQFYKGSIKNMLLNFANNDELSKEEIEDLIKMVESEN